MKALPPPADTDRVDAAFIGAAMEVSERHVRRMADKAGWLFEEVGGRGPGKRCYKLATLPKDILAAVQAHRMALATQAVLNSVPALRDPVPARVTSATAVAQASREVTSPRAPTQEELEPHLTTAERAVLTARRLVLRQVEDLMAARACSQSRAVDLLLAQAQAGLLPAATVGLLQRAKSPQGRKGSHDGAGEGLPCARAVRQWLRVAADGAVLVRSGSRPDLTVQPWHALAIQLRARPQGSTLTWLHEQLHALWQPAYGPAVPSYDVVARFFRDKYSKTDQLKGRYTGSELRSRTFYQHRTSEGMAPFQEVHADGWTTHFTAPHPVTGEFVTYELWHFHDVATRYVTPMAIGLTENTDVILAGLKECVRVGGVPAILQTDSTGSVKNARVEYDDAAGVAGRLGISIVHPQTVGNSQANGIAENFNTWLDDQARELATYQHPDRMDSGTFKRLRKITNAMVKATDPAERARQRAAAMRIGKGIVFENHDHAVAWIRALEPRWNDHAHRSLPKVRNAEGRLVHMTPNQALQAARAEGWQPVALTEAELADAFRPHLRKKVTRGAVTPFNGQRYRHEALDAWEGEEVLVVVDRDDSARVWVKDLDGRMLCEAAFVAATRYRTENMAEHAERKRAEAQIKRREQQIGQIEARMDRPALEMDGGDNAIELPQALQRIDLAALPPVPDDEPPPRMTWMETQMHILALERARAERDAQDEQGSDDDEGEDPDLRVAAG
jgi:putative transposase